MVGERIIIASGQRYQHMPSSGQNNPYYLFASRISQMIHLRGWQFSNDSRLSPPYSFSTLASASRPWSHNYILRITNYEVVWDPVCVGSERQGSGTVKIVEHRMVLRRVSVDEKEPKTLTWLPGLSLM